MGWTDLYNDAVAQSIATDDTVEHIFKQIPAGNYEIVVNQFDGGGRDFGLAWWLGESIPGDFDDDDDVDGDDLGEWESNFGSGSGADGDSDGDSDGNDFLVWQQNVGLGGAAVAANEPVPEPAAWLLAAVGLPVLLKRRAA